MPQPAINHFPPMPDEPLQEGARWRHHRPSGEQVATWFSSQPLDEGMEHKDYVGGVVLIPQSEKVKYTRKDGGGTVERYEMVFTPYIQIGTRIAYFRRLAEYRGLIPYIGPSDVPRARNPESAYFNGNLPDGFWWHLVQGSEGPVRYLCCTMVAQMFKPQEYMARLGGEPPMPVLSGIGTKQGSGGADPNGLMKISTGAMGRALAAAGILVAGTGAASAEDMLEFSGLAAAAPDQEPALPPVATTTAAAPEPTDPAAQLAALRSQAQALAVQMQESNPESFRQFNLWWQERQSTEGWKTLGDVPLTAMKGVIIRMQRLLAEVWPADEPAPNDKTGVAS